MVYKVLTQTYVHQEHQVDQQLPQSGSYKQFSVVGGVFSQCCAPQSLRKKTLHM